jgi:uncharacterized SAM-binding protein YcdF (DUF218 family)
MKKRFVAFLLALAVIFAGVGVLALTFGVARGALVLGVGLVCGAGAAVAPRVRRRAPRFYKVVSRAVVAVCALAAAVSLVASAQILSRYSDGDAPPGSVMVVLGCGLSPTDHTAPSLMLARRLDAAYAYLEAHPDAVCVLSGGQGADERVSEARAMYDDLVARGVAPERLYREEKSTSTHENLALSRQLIEENGLSADDIALVTDGFHQFRAHSIARALGMTAHSVSARAPFGLVVFFWLREIGGVVTQVWF